MNKGIVRKESLTVFSFCLLPFIFLAPPPPPTRGEMCFFWGGGGGGAGEEEGCGGGLKSIVPLGLRSFEVVLTRDTYVLAIKLIWLTLTFLTTL